MNEKKLKVAMYIRIGRNQKQDIEKLILTQKKALEEYAKKINNIESQEFYIDINRSGKSFNRRPALTKMLNNIKKKRNKIDIVIVKDISRFGRNIDVLMKIVELKEKYNTDFIAIDSSIDTRKKNVVFMIKGLYETYMNMEKQRIEMEKEFEEEN